MPNYDTIAEQSLCILDLGIERKYKENYNFNNRHRNYEGYLFQYTLDGCRMLETHGISHRLIKGKGFFIFLLILLIIAGITYLPLKIQNNHGHFFIFIFLVQQLNHF